MDYDLNKGPIPNSNNSLPEDGKTKEKALLLVGVIVLIAAGFYFIFYKGLGGLTTTSSDKKPALEMKPAITERGIVGEVVAVDGEAKNISVKVFDDGGKNYTVAVAPSAAVVKVKADLGKTSEVEASFFDLASGQNVNVVYEGGHNNGSRILAKRIAIIEFSPPSGIGADYPKTPPGK